MEHLTLQPHSLGGIGPAQSPLDKKRHPDGKGLRSTGWAMFSESPATGGDLSSEWRQHVPHCCPDGDSIHVAQLAFKDEHQNSPLPSVVKKSPSSLRLKYEV